MRRRRRPTLAAAGIRILKLALTFPVVPATVAGLADAATQILVVEEKRPFVEQQVRAAPGGGGSTPVRKRDAGDGRPLVPATASSRPSGVAEVLGRLLPDLAPAPAAPRQRAHGPAPARPAGPHPGVLQRLPSQPLDGGARRVRHRRRRRLPRHDPLRAPARRRGFVPPTPMGAEGCTGSGWRRSWATGTCSRTSATAPSATPAAWPSAPRVAAGVHITFKLLYNSAVAMTGGQDVAGLMDVPSLTRSLAAEGVSAITVCTDDVDRYGRAAAFAPGVQVRPVRTSSPSRRSSGAHPGVSVLVYDQRCAAEARRLASGASSTSRRSGS